MISRDGYRLSDILMPLNIIKYDVSSGQMNRGDDPLIYNSRNRDCTLQRKVQHSVSRIFYSGDYPYDNHSEKYPDNTPV